jgi:hypothetical protein
VEYVDRILQLKMKVMTADQVTAIELGFEYRNQSLERFLVRFFLLSPGKRQHQDMLLAEFVLSLEKYNKLELIHLFQELLHQYDSEMMHAFILSKSHIENYLSTRKELVEKTLDKPKPSSLFPLSYTSTVTEVYYSALFHQAQTSLIRALRHKGFFGMGADAFSSFLNDRPSVTIIDLLAVLTRVMVRILKKYFPPSQILSERGLDYQGQDDHDLLEELKDYDRHLDGFFCRDEQSREQVEYRSHRFDYDINTHQIRLKIGEQSINPRVSSNQYNTPEHKRNSSPIMTNFYEKSSDSEKGIKKEQYGGQPIFKSLQQSRNQQGFFHENSRNNCNCYCLYEKLLDEVLAVWYQAEKSFLQVQAQLKKEQTEVVKELATRVLGMVVETPLTIVPAK